MSEPIIFNSADFCFSDADNSNALSYKGKPFTGKLFINGGSDIGNEVVDYADGMIHGHDLVFYPNGNSLADNVYHQGRCVSQKEWYDDGKPRKEWDVNTEHLWDCDGMLAKDNAQWLYKNGQPIEEQSHHHTSYFSPSGDLAVKQVYTELGNGRYCNVSYYYDHVLRQCFEALFTNYYPELDTHFSRCQLLPGWLNAVYQENSNLGYKLMDSLINHSTRQTRELAVELKTNAINKENLNAKADHLLPPVPNHIVVKLDFDTRF
ncbi:hypothetical protein [Mucilaginibacter sp. CSA2-8R]|uniref:hypothetical protein n=1 Tax=Mucilaginibacter sp. CSA2-8R TaxID=3141542 RepID=UPI00315D4ACA